MSVVLPGLILGGFEESFDRSILERHGVTHVLNVAEECEVSQRVGLCYGKYGVPDDDPEADITAILDGCMDFMQSSTRLQGGCVFVHCLEGVSRSVCVVLCYMVLRLGWCPVKAMARLRSCRPAVDPYKPYLNQTLRKIAKTIESEYKGGATFL
jgi:protein-tyrosine phosphatase